MGFRFGDAYRDEQRRIHREAMRPRRQPRAPREPRQRSGYTPSQQPPSYEQPTQPASGWVEGVVTTAFGLFGAFSGAAGSAATGALPGQQGDANDFGRNLYESSRTDSRDRQSWQIERGTRSRGQRNGWSGGG